MQQRLLAGFSSTFEYRAGQKLILDNPSSLDPVYINLVTCRQSGNVRGFHEALTQLGQISHEHTFQCDETFCETGVGDLLMDMTFSNDGMDKPEHTQLAYFILYDLIDCNNPGFSEYFISEGLINKCVMSLAGDHVMFQTRAMMLLLRLCYLNRRAAKQVQEQIAVPDRFVEIIQCAMTESTRVPDHREMFIEMASTALWVMFAISPSLDPQRYDKWIDALRFVVEFNAFRPADIQVVLSWADILANYGIDTCERMLSAFRVSRVTALIAMANKFISDVEDDTDDGIVYTARLFAHIIESFAAFPDGVSTEMSLSGLRVFLKSESDDVKKHVAKCFYAASKNEYMRTYLAAMDVVSEMATGVANSSFSAKRYMVLTVCNLVLEAKEARLGAIVDKHGAFVVAQGLEVIQEMHLLTRVLHALNVLLDYAGAPYELHAIVMEDLNRAGYLDFCEKVQTDDGDYPPELLEHLDRLVTTIESREEECDESL